jgi:adenosylhomocysteine nucleosidase
MESAMGMMLCVKTGMRNEYDLAKRYALGALVLTGIQTLADLEKNVPKTCTGIMSFGMCGGLRPGEPTVGQTVFASQLIGPQGTFLCNYEWNYRLCEKVSGAISAPYYSSGEFNQADTPAQRATIYARTRAWCVDDESLFVAQFARARNIPFVIARNVSDQWDDDVSVTASILDDKGKPKPLEVLSALLRQPITLVKIGLAYNRSQSGLTQLAQQIGPDFGFQARITEM